MHPNRLIVIMGLPGSGKTSLGKITAERLGYTFYDMDDTMPKEMKDKMKNNQLVSPEERSAYQKSWMEDLKELLKSNSVIASLVLMKEHQRKLLYEVFPDPVLINLKVPLETLKQRLQKRKGHFFNEQTLEKAFNANEEVVVKHVDIDGTKSMDVVAKEILNSVA